MNLSIQQIRNLIELGLSTKADTMGCDGCFELMDQLAQAELDASPIDESLELVKHHLEQCKCCRDEYESLLQALRATVDPIQNS